MRRHLVLMTKSKKGEDGYCVAGIDIDSGEWVRLNVRGCYSVPRKWFRYKDGTEPELLDAFSVDITAKDNSERLQPENFYCNLRELDAVDEDVTDSIIERITKDAIHNYVFYNSDISVDSQWLYENGINHYSLMVIEPSDLTFYRDDWGKVLAYFEYKGQKYRGIRVTDLEFINHWDETGQIKHYRPKEKCLLVLSLGLPYSREDREPPRCWKLIASVIKLANSDDADIDGDDGEDSDDGESQLSFTDAEDSALDLFEELKEIRSSLAREEGVPPYCVFQDKSLRSMCELLPVNDEEFLSVYGAGQKRLKKYGEAFMEAIRGYVEDWDSGDDDYEENDESYYEDDNEIDSYDEDINRITQLMEDICEGYDPETGEELDEEELKNNAQFCAIVERLYHKFIQPQTIKLKRAGTPWNEEEDEALEEEYLEGLEIEEIAELHERTVGAIKARLIKQGLVEA